MERIAECCCGNANITVKGEPLLHAVCHCDDCKKRTGSGFGISTYFSNNQIIQSNGDMKIYHIENTDHTQQRSFCFNCGTTLFWKVSVFKNITGISGGCFVKQPLASPSINANNNQECTWLTLNGDWQTSFDLKILTHHKLKPNV